ncbi:MAG TPA: hypothetical protein DIS94_10115 [Bacteroidetes bacterium]|nr:hypothetical protein [Bacteroidota bacterium]
MCTSPPLEGDLGGGLTFCFSNRYCHSEGAKRFAQVPLWRGI